MTRVLTTLAVVLALSPGVAWAQHDEPRVMRSIDQRMGDVIDSARFDGVSARRALEWWSQVADIPLIVPWEALERHGVSPDTPITLQLTNVPAGTLLALVMRQLATDTHEELLYQSTPWYIQLLTKTMANRQTVLRVYDVRDMLHEIPTFDNAPTMDLQQSLSNTGSARTSGGGGGGGTSTLFGRVNVDQQKQSKTQQGQEIAQLIRDTIEPSIWQENGGEFSSVRYYNGRLIVNAPLYVHAQIGYPEITTRQPAGDAATPTPMRWTAVKPDQPKPEKGKDVSAVQSGPPKPVSGVGR